MLELVINRGIPGSGKSTYAHSWVTALPKRIRVNRDDERMQGYNCEFGPPIDENAVTIAQHGKISSLLGAGYSVIVDDCNIEPKFLKPIAHIGWSFGANVSINQIDVSLGKALENNGFRARNGGRFVPEDVITKMFNRMNSIGRVTLEPPEPLVPYIRPVNGVKAIMVDIDGTLAKMGNRSPYEWRLVGVDSPIDEIINTVNLYAAMGYTIILMSGRDSSCREETIKWLFKHGVTFDYLHMRPTGDMRKDNIVKNELFDEYVRFVFDVEIVLDDRDQVVKMWRGLGLRVYQVAEGKF
jgi:predicted kinase